MSQLFKLANTSYMGKPAATVPEFLQLGVTVLPDLIRDSSDQRAARLSLAESMFQNSDYADAQPVLAQLITDSNAAHDDATEAAAEGFAGRIAYNLGDTERASNSPLTPCRFRTGQALRHPHAYASKSFTPQTRKTKAFEPMKM